MSEQKQRPHVWLIWDSELEYWADNVFDDPDIAALAANGDEVVEMVPRHDVPPKCPRVFCVLAPDHDGKFVPVEASADFADAKARADEYELWKVVEMVPREPDGREELIAALKRCILTISQVRADLSEAGKWEKLDRAEDVIEKAKDALRKAGDE